MKTDDLDRLRAALRRGDPAADGREPDAGELGVLRERLLESAAARRRPAPPARPRALRPAFAAAAATAAVLVLTLGLAVALQLHRAVDRPPGSERSGEEAAAGTLGAGAETPRQQIQFTTPGGTRIVWVLYPEPPVHP
jgi:hypothetical protein